MSEQSAHLIRSVGFWGLAAMVFNGMVGAGVFALPGSVANEAGVWAPLIVLGVGVGLLPVVLAFASLSGMFDRTGGPIVYVGEAFGRVAGFQVGWLAILSTVASAAANANLLADYALFAAPSAAHTPLMHTLVVLASLLLTLLVNLASASRSAGVLRLASVVKLAPLLWLLLMALPSAWGFAGVELAHWSPAKAALLAAYAFTGFEGGLTPAGEARNPKRDLPRAVIGVFLVVVLLYAALTWGYVAVAYQSKTISLAPLARMGQILGGSVGLKVIFVGAVLSISANLISSGLFASRRLLALEERGDLPRWFGWINPANGVPRNAVFFIVAVATGLALSGGFAALAVLSVTARMLVYLLSLAALPVLRARHGLRRLSLDHLWVGLGGVTCAGLVIQSELKSWIGVGVALTVGLVILLMARQARAAMAQTS